MYASRPRDAAGVYVKHAVGVYVKHLRKRRPAGGGMSVHFQENLDAPLITKIDAESGYA